MTEEESRCLTRKSSSRRPADCRKQRSIKAARQKAPKDLLEIAPFFVVTEINFSGVPLNTGLEIKVLKAARDKADAIQKELVGQLNKLADDLIVLRKQDQQGSDKAGESAEKRVKTVGDQVEEALYDFGHDVRKTAGEGGQVSRLASRASVADSSGGSSWCTLSSGGAKAAFTEAYEEQAKEFDKIGDEALSSARDEENQRESVQRALEDAVKSAKEQVEEMAKASEQAKNKVAKQEKRLKDAEDDKEKKAATEELEEAKKERDELPSKQTAAWNKWVIQEARSMQSQMQGWANTLQQFQKALEAADKEALKALNKLKKDAEEKQKKAVQKVMDELHKLSKSVSSRYATVNYMFGEYKKSGAIAAKADDWNKRLVRDVSTVKTMKDLSAQELNKAAREMVQIAGKMP